MNLLSSTSDFFGLDIGTMACDMFTKVIHNAKTILWNGPMGVFEMDSFQHGTKGIAKAVAEGRLRPLPTRVPSRRQSRTR